MNIKAFFAGLMFLPALANAQAPDKCGDVAILPKALYDSFQVTRANLNNTTATEKTDRERLEGLQKAYLACETQSDVAAMLKDADAALKTAITDQRYWAAAFARVDEEVRHFIKDTHGKKTVYRYLDPYGGGPLGGVVTMTFTINDDKIDVIHTYMEIPEQK